MSCFIFPMVTNFSEELPFLLNGIGIQHDQEHIKRPDGFPFYQWIQCHNGQGILLLNGKEYPVAENQGMFLRPDEPHEYYAVTANWTVDWINFTGYHIYDFIVKLSMTDSGVYYISHPEILKNKIRAAYTSAISGNAMNVAECSVLAYDILVSLSRYTSKDPVNDMYHKYFRLIPVMEYIEQNYNKQLTLDELSKVLEVSPQHLCNQFKSSLGTRVFEYINKVRIQKSKELILTHKVRTIKEIAALTGFIDFSYFCSVFKKIEKISPGEFRKLYGT